MATICILLLWLFSFSLFAQTIQPINLKPFVGSSPFDDIGAKWTLPHGPQVIDGTPFQMDGVVFLEKSRGRNQNPAMRTNVNNVPVGLHFDLLYVLAATHSQVKDGDVVTSIQLQYADGSSVPLPLVFGKNILRWYGLWHKPVRTLPDTNTHDAWRAQASDPAKSDNTLRLLHIVLTNPFPQKEVRALSLATTNRAGLILAAMSVGPSNAAPLPDTIVLSTNSYPDLRPRHGDLVRGEGIVKNKNGNPIAGAFVRIISTRPFNKNFDQANSDDPAFGKETSTGADGRFILPPLPDDRLYHLLIGAAGYATFLYGGDDPKSDPIEVRLTSTTAPVGKYSVHGRVINPDGKPAALVPVEKDGIGYEGGTSWGDNEGLPDQVYTDVNGEFVLARDKPFTRIQIRTHAKDMAPVMQWLSVSNTIQTIQLSVGSMLRGRIVKDGQPLAHVQIGVSGSVRDSERYVGHYETKTGEDGVFTFPHLPPSTEWCFYGIISSLKTYGALPMKAVTSGNDGTTNDLGDLAVIPALHLAGKVKTRDDAPFPKSLKLSLGYDGPWDSVDVGVNTNGQFVFDGLYAGRVELSLEPDDWRLSPANRSIDIWNSWQMTGLIETNKDNLLVLIEKGNRNYNSYWNGNGQLPQQDQPQSRPFEGVEPSDLPPIVLAGRIVDAKTGQPIPKCKITPGLKPPALGAPPSQTSIQKILQPFKAKNVPWNELPFWELAHAETVSNGTFLLEFMHLTSTPMLRVEADGYEPFISEPIPFTTRNLVIQLSHGNGPNGVVLLSDGRPAENATLIYAVAREQFGLNNKQLDKDGEKDGVTKTGKDGKFSFAARPEAQTLYVSHEAGWAQQSVKEGGDDLKLQLQPWAAITGTLVNKNGKPAAGIELEITMYHDWEHGGPLVHIQQMTFTDAMGVFHFSNAPPTRLEVQRIVRSGFPNGGYSDMPQTWCVVEPGITNDLGKVILDTPPPPTVVDQIKQKLGL